MKGRIKEDDSTVPSPDGPFAYYTRYREGGQHPILCRQPRDGGAEQVLLDGDALAAGKAYFQLGGSAHSPDHRLLAWSADDKGSEIDTLRMRDLATGHDLPDEIPDAEGSIVWSADSTVLLLRAARCQSPALARLSAPPRHARSGRRPRLRGTGQPVLRLARRTAIPALRRRFRCTITKHPRAGCSIWRTRMPSRGLSRRAKPRCSTTSSITRIGTAKRGW